VICDTEPHSILMLSTRLAFHVLLSAVTLRSSIHAFGTDLLVSRAGLDVLADEAAFEELEDVESGMCLLQKDAIINAAAQPSGYDGPWTNPKGLDQWEKQYVSDPIHGVYFKNPKDMGPSTTVDMEEPSHPVKIAPTDSPVDSLVAPGPAPVPQLATRTSFWQHVSWSAALFGVAALWISFFLISFTPGHKGRSSTVQYTLSAMFAVFCGKLSYAAIDLLTAASLKEAGWSQAYWAEFLTKDATMEAVFVRVTIFGVLYILAHVVLAFCASIGSNKIRALVVASNFSAALLGFALVDACAVALRLPGNQDPWKYFWVAVACGLALVCFLYLCMKFTHGERVSIVSAPSPSDGESQHYVEAVAEFDTTMVSIALGFLVFKVIESTVLGGGRVKGAAFDDRASADIMWMMVAVAILVGCACYATAAEKEATQQERLNFFALSGKTRPPPFFELAQSSLLVGAGWCAVTALSWFFSSGQLQVDLLQTGFSTPPLAAALVLSAIVCFGAAALGNLRPASETLWHRWFVPVDHTYWNVLNALGFVMALALATCFIHAARDLSTFWGANSHVAEASLCVSFAIFIMPFWMLFILPDLDHPMSKVGQLVQGAENALQRVEQRAESVALRAESAVHRAESAVQRGVEYFMGTRH